NRTGFTSGWSFGEINFYPKEGSNFWLKRIYPFYFGRVGHDQVQDGREDFLHTGLRFNFTRQGYFNVSTQQGHEAWIGRRFKTGNRLQLFGGVQIVRWLNLQGNFGSGRAIFYDPVNPFQGRNKYGYLGISF